MHNLCEVRGVSRGPSIELPWCREASDFRTDDRCGNSTLAIGVKFGTFLGQLLVLFNKTGKHLSTKSCQSCFHAVTVLYIYAIKLGEVPSSPVFALHKKSTKVVFAHLRLGNRPPIPCKPLVSFYFIVPDIIIKWAVAYNDYQILWFILSLKLKQDKVSSISDAL